MVSAGANQPPLHLSAIWQLADFPTAPAFVRHWSNSGQSWIFAWDDCPLMAASLEEV